MSGLGRPTVSGLEPESKSHPCSFPGAGRRCRDYWLLPHSTNMTTSVGIMLGVWNALVLGGGGAAFIRRKQLAEWITGGDNLQRGQVRSTDDGDAWEAFLAEHLELEPPRRSRIAARPRVLTGESAIRPSHWWRASGLDLSPVFGLCQRPDVLTSSSAVMVGESGTEPLGALSISARRPIRARSSSRKRVQSARNSSLTKSPGRSGPRAGGGWGCSVGPEITPHLGVERWISRDFLVRRRLSPGSCRPATPSATLRGRTRRVAP